MPTGNHFQPADTSGAEPTAPYEVVDHATAQRCKSVTGEAWLDRMREVGRRLRAAGVSTIYLANGTWAGDDPIGFWTTIESVWPAASSSLRTWTKSLTDATFGEAGNFTAAYAARLERALRGTGDGPAVRRFTWSGQNFHSGRLAGAVRLFDDLGQHSWQDDERVLLLGHSHAGNVFALLTNLLVADPALVEDVLAQAAIYAGDRTDSGAWKRVRERVAARQIPVLPKNLGFVTLGMPIRYGFDNDGFGHLLHIINHHPQEGMPVYKAGRLRSLDDFLHGQDGDYVQQLGIPGSSGFPCPLLWRQFIANHRLRDRISVRRSLSTYLDRLTAGRRVSEDGTTVLVDFGNEPRHIIEHVVGHGVYTHSQWMLLQMELIAGQFYGRE